MIFNVTQTDRELFGARFVFCGEIGTIGEASLQGSLGSMEGFISGNFYGSNFEMNFGRPDLRLLPHLKPYVENDATGSPAFRPYLLKVDGVDCGSVYQTKYQGGFLKSYGFHQMVKDGQVYDLFPIGFGKEGNKSPVYCGDTQISLVEKECIVYNDLHEYHVFAEDRDAGLISVLFCMYMYVNAAYKPGVKVTQSKVNSVSLTTNKLLKGKYDPDFKSRIGK